jgi:hypothetical protein
MIQRIQSVYLALVFVFTVLLCVVPAGTFRIEGSGIADNYVYKAVAVTKEATGEKVPLNATTFLTLEVVIISLITLFALFSYRNRILQIKLGRFNLLINFVLITLLFYYTEHELSALMQGYSIHLSYGAGAFLPLINVMLILLANRSIRKDEELVRSADRLR